MTFGRSLITIRAVRRLLAILLLAAFVGQGSGLLQYLHLSEHAAKASVRAGAKAVDLPNADDHDEAACQVCLALHASLFAGGYAPLLVLLGLVVVFLTQIAAPLRAQPALVRIDCRGPPRP